MAALVPHVRTSVPDVPGGVTGVPSVKVGHPDWRSPGDEGGTVCVNSVTAATTPTFARTTSTATYRIAGCDRRAGRIFDGRSLAGIRYSVSRPARIRCCS